MLSDNHEKNNMCSSRYVISLLYTLFDILQPVLFIVVVGCRRIRMCAPFSISISV